MKSTSRKIIFCILLVFLLMILPCCNTNCLSITFSTVHAESDAVAETEASTSPAVSAIPEASPAPSNEPAELESFAENSPADEPSKEDVFSLPIFFSTIIGFISNLSIEHITLFSVLVTLIIFVSGKQSEIKYKQLEARREEYAKFIRLLQKSIAGGVKMNQETKKEFFDAGASLLLYGSKRVYKKYLFFREFTSNPLIVNSKYNIKEIGIYVIADMLKAIRHEVGLTSFRELSTNEALAFFVNDIGMNPKSKIQSYRARYSIFMIKAELFAIDRLKFVFAQKIYYCVLKPLLGIVSLLWKFLISIPLGWLLTKLFPKWSAKVIQEKKTDKNT